MRGHRFRLKTPTVAIAARDGHNVPITIPKGGEVEVANGPLEGDRLLDVVWEGKTVRMFTQDIRSRGERLDGEG
jgi:hypothetical protein